MRKFILYLFLFLVGCSRKDSRMDQESLPFSDGKNQGIIDRRLEEASGLAESFAQPGYYWTINDSGNPPLVFLIDTLAQIKMQCRLRVSNRDWEDIAIGKGPNPDKKYLYVADIGDNLGIHEYKYIYRLEEPLLKNGADQTVSQVDTLVVKLPDEKRDTETLMIDPVNNDLYLISKREDEVNVYFHQFPYPDTLLMKRVLTIPFTKIVSGSISQDAREILLKDYDHIYYWKRSDEKSLIELLAKEPVQLPYTKELQGESICWNQKATGFYTLGESREDKMAQLKFYKRLNSK